MQNDRLKLKIIFLAILFCGIFGLAKNSQAATYYVDSVDGLDTNDGLAVGTPWATVAKVNAFAFSDGDTVCFKRGETFSDATLTKNDVNNFTIRDYGAGVRPLFNSNITHPIYINGGGLMSNLTIMNIDISGQDHEVGKDTNLTIVNVEGVVLDGIFGDGHYQNNTNAGKSAIQLNNCSGMVIVRNCELYNWGPPDLPILSNDFVGITIMNQSSGTYEIYDNVVHDVNSDCVLAMTNMATCSIHDNIFYNGGENSIDVKGTTNCTVYANTFYRTESFTGHGGNLPDGSGGTDDLVVVHWNDVTYANNNIIRNNNFAGGSGHGIGVSMAAGTVIANNEFSDLPVGIRIGNYADLLVHNNLIINPDIYGIYINDGDPDVEVYNNTIYNSTGTAAVLFYVGESANAKIYNNIAYQCLTGSDKYAFYALSTGIGPDLQNNCWYSNGDYVAKYRSAGDYIMSQQSDWRSAGHINDLFAYPLFISTTDFHLQNISPAINAGTDVGLTEDFDSNPIVGAPDIGAYEYQGDITPPMAPGGLSVN